MKKIRQIDEKLLRLVRLYLMDYRIVEKWNKMPKGAKEGIEYAINEVSEILENQEVSQPEEKEFAPYFDNDYRCPECQEELLVTCKHPLELYCTCCRRDINLGEMEEELTFVKETLPKRKTENNTEEWKEIHDTLKPHHKECERYSDTLNRVLSERSFSKEELEFVGTICRSQVWCYGNKLVPILEKVDKLLSLEKEK